MIRKLICLTAFAMTPVAALAEACPAPFDAAKSWPEARGELAGNYAYWDRIEANALFDAATPAMLASPDRLAFADRLQTLLLLFRDSHLHVTPTSKPAAAWIPSAADFWLAGQDGKLIVADVKAGSDAAAKGLRPGWELLQMDGADPRDTVRTRFAALGVTADPAQELYAVNALVSGRIDTARRFVFRSGSKQVMLDLPAGYASVRRPDAPLTVTMRTAPSGRRIAVIRINNSLGSDALIPAFDQAVAGLAPGTQVILDLRDTPSGGNSTQARAIIGHFIAEPRPYQRHELTAERVQSGVPRVWVEYAQPRAPHLPAPVVLAGLWTGSMGEGLTIGLNAAAGARVAGSPMGQLLGAIIQDELPAACLTVSFANEKLWHIDGTPREAFRPGDAVPAADTAADGSDAALALALTLADQAATQPR